QVPEPTEDAGDAQPTPPRKAETPQPRRAPDLSPARHGDYTLDPTWQGGVWTSALKGTKLTQLAAPHPRARPLLHCRRGCSVPGGSSATDRRSRRHQPPRQAVSGGRLARTCRLALSVTLGVGGPPTRPGCRLYSAS